MFHIIQELLEEPTFKANVKFRIKTYSANEKILLQGKKREDIYLIDQGRVRISIASNKKNQPLHPGIAEFGPGDIFGEFGLFDEKNASADVVAITDCKLLLIDIPTFKAYLDANTAIGYRILGAMLRHLVNRIHKTDKTILTLYSWGMKAHQLDEHLQETPDTEINPSHIDKS